MNFRPNIKRFFRSPKVIIAELAALAFASSLGAALPQASSASADELARWHNAGPFVTALVKIFALDHIFSSVWFLTITAAASISLAIVVVEQFRRLRTLWSQPPSADPFQNAPFRTEFERPATASEPQAKIWSERRLGLAGSLVFHSSLLAIMLAGMLRALFATDAATDLLETETLPPQPAAWTAQFPGVAARPFSLDREITLREVKATRYADGDLRSLSLRIAAGGAEKEIQINQEVRLGGNRIFSAREFGPAAVVEWTQNGTTLRRAVLLAETGPGNFEGTLDAGQNVRAYFRSHIDNAGDHPGTAEVRVMNGSVLLATETLPAGATLALPGGGKLTLHGLPFWARLHGSRDSALWLAYAGMILTMAGAAMIFCLVKLDFCVVVTPLGEREKVFVALKPQRFAPLFQERFEKLVYELGGNSSAAGIFQKPVERSSLSPGERAGVRADATTQISIQQNTPVASLPAVRTAVLLLLGSTCLALTSGCDRVSQSQAKQLVERYNQVVSEAYRRGDVRLIDPVVGPNEGKKLTGLIGVRLDLGITLDSQLLSLDITGVEQAKDSLLVRTKERWSYRDLKIGSGVQVGEASQDSYEMTYFFTNMNKAWLVDEIKFAAPPQVGRTNTPWIADRTPLHEVTAKEVKP